MQKDQKHGVKHLQDCQNSIVLEYHGGLIVNLTDISYIC